MSETTTFVIAPGTAGPADVVVTTAGGSAILRGDDAIGFAYLAPPLAKGSKPPAPNRSW